MSGRSCARLRVYALAHPVAYAPSRANLFSWRVTSIQFSTVTARANRREWMWCYEVIDSTGKVVLEDNGSKFPAILNDGLRALNAVRTIENAGHRLAQSFADLVSEVAA